MIINRLLDFALGYCTKASVTESTIAHKSTFMSDKAARTSAKREKDDFSRNTDF